MKKLFTLSFLFLLMALSTIAQQLVEPTFSSADQSSETWYYIRFKRQAANNLVWTTDFPVTSAIKQLAKAGTPEDRMLQQWKLVGNKDAFYIQNRTLGFKVKYASSGEKDVNKSIHGNNYVVDDEGGDGATALKLAPSSDAATWTGALGWTIINTSISATAYMNDRGAGGSAPDNPNLSGYAWRDVCNYGYADAGFLMEFVDASTQTIVIVTDSLAQEARVGYSGKATYTGIDNFNIDGNITAAITGADAAAFGFAGDDNIVENGTGSLEITFAPTEARIYNATLTLNGGTAPSVTVRLTGEGYEALNLPQFSEGTNEYWYYIQFHRRAAANTVWSLSDTTLMIVQDTLRPGIVRDDQQWKIVGNWTDGYAFVNKETGKEIIYNATASDDGTKPANRYLQAEGEGDVFSFVRYKQGGVLTEDWQLFNLIASTANKYVNDEGAKYLCNWSANSEGDRLLFIPADQPDIIAPSTPLAFEARPGTDSLRSLSIVGLGLSADITAVISGADASAFSLEAATVSAGGGTFRITFSPVEAKQHIATLTLTSGSVTKTVSLTGDANLGLPLFSTETVENWYYIQFVRQDRSTAATPSNRVWTKTPVTVATESGEVTVQQIFSKQLEEGNTAQQWKIVGDEEEGYRIISREGGEFLLSGASDPVALRIVLETFGDKFLFTSRNTATTGVYSGKWKLQIVEKFDGEDRNILNDFGGGANDNPIGLYTIDDDGAYIKFIPASGGNAIEAPTLDTNEAVVPGTTGIYIVHNIYASGKILATKQLIIK